MLRKLSKNTQWQKLSVQIGILTPELLLIQCATCCYYAYDPHSRLKGVGEGYP